MDIGSRFEEEEARGGHARLQRGLEFLGYRRASSLSAWLALAIAAVKVMVVGLHLHAPARGDLRHPLVGLVVVLFIAILCFGLVADVAMR